MRLPVRCRAVNYTDFYLDVHLWNWSAVFAVTAVRKIFLDFMRLITDIVAYCVKDIISTLSAVHF